MVFTLQSGTVEAKVNDNEFTVHKNGIWQVPRGKSSFILFSQSYMSCVSFWLYPLAKSSHASHLRVAGTQTVDIAKPQVGSSYAPSAYDVSHHISRRTAGTRALRSEAATDSRSLQYRMWRRQHLACSACCATLDAVYLSPTQPATLGNPMAPMSLLGPSHVLAPLWRVILASIGVLTLSLEHDS